MPASRFPTKINRLLRADAYPRVIRRAGIFLCRAGAALVLLLTSVGLRPEHAVASSDQPTERLVAVGDVHGDFDDFCLMLKRTGLLDDQNHWIGGSTTLAQTGDLVDRGPQSREALDLLIRIEKEASKTGGQVVPLLGNHEVMNVLGDLRYVTPQNYAAFADSESAKRRKNAYEQYAAWYANHAKLFAAIKQPALPATEQGWMAEHPAGFLEHREAFSPNGNYGKWLRQHAAIVKIGGVIFLHGGISPNLISLQLEQINSQGQAEIEEFDRTKQDLGSRKVIFPSFTTRQIAATAKLEELAD